MGIFSPFSAKELLPKEERIEIINKAIKIYIGIPKENFSKEKRIILTPDAVGILTSRGINITIESGAGEGSFFSDKEYVNSGAKIVYEKKEVFSQPIIMKVSPPSSEELILMNNNAILISSIQSIEQGKEYFKTLISKQITSIAFELIRDEHNQLSLMRLISEIAGTYSILHASKMIDSSDGGYGLLLGGITGLRSTNVLIIGAGSLAENAIKAALGLGAEVRVFDNSIYKLKRLKNLFNNNLFTSTIDPKELTKSLARCDVVIGCLRTESKAPVLVTKSMVEIMKPGSVIIDLTINNGGIFETSKLTENNKNFVYKDIVHCCIPNITSYVPRTTSKALSNFFLNFLQKATKNGGIENMLVKSQGEKFGIYTYRGKVTNLNISNKFKLPYYDINFLLNITN